MRDQTRFDLHVLEKALESPVVRIDLGPTGKRGGELGEIDRFDLEQCHDERGQAFHAGKMSACKVELENIGEHGRMIHGVISWYFSRWGKGRGWPPTIGDYTLFFNRLFFCRVQCLRATRKGFPNHHIHRSVTKA